MRQELRHALSALTATADLDAEVWGWRGRTLSRAVRTEQRNSAWLRLVAAPTGATDHIFWHGNRASCELPAAIPRPRLRRVHDWASDGWNYRAELYDRARTATVHSAPVLAIDPALPRSWWGDLREALTTLAGIPTRRRTIIQPTIDWLLRTYIDPSIPTAVTHWTTAHGDLRWTNLCGPPLEILDWEGWGLAPMGYDIAMLHSFSLLTPTTAARIRAEFADLFSSRTGRQAELIAIAELLHLAAQGDHAELVPPLRNRATELVH
ncbi:hypothetical protein AB8O55_22425 [Saccharopolyspora cebuensis]|uniref:Aminoglycoside phosphotransferase domain-containing protein n=1 Tax=Saccharopolyspora cebuensis TaxID=418759 RepID=A0ABV4CN76_9PSEU